MSFDNGCFTAAIINLGVKGHLQIVEDDDYGTTLKKRSGGKPLAPEEQTLMTRLFGTDNSVLLDNVNHVIIGGAKEGLDESLSKTYLGKLFANNFGWSGVGLLLGVLVVAAVFLALASGNQYALLWVAAITSGIAVIPMMIGAGLTFVGWQRADRGKGRLIGGVVLTTLVVAGAMIAMWLSHPGMANLVLTGALLAVGAIAAIGFPLLQAPSRSGRKIMDQIEGFREYLAVAEEDRLNFVNPPEKTPELFERFLPYAVALDCQNAWGAKFAGVLAAAGAAAAATGWYVGSRDWSNDPASFADHLGSDLSQTISSSSTAPGSSDGGGGSGGGGSSGGGGGGGGGGGWRAGFISPTIRRQNKQNESGR
jgi:uncharacterized membrane protein YgcG